MTQKKLRPIFNVGDLVFRSSDNDEAVRFNGEVVVVIEPGNFDLVSQDLLYLDKEGVKEAFAKRDPDWQNNYIYVVEDFLLGPVSYEKACQILPNLTHKQYKFLLKVTLKQFRAIHGLDAANWLALESDLMHLVQ